MKKQILCLKYSKFKIWKNKSKNLILKVRENRTASTRRLTVTGNGFHDFNRMIDVDEKEDTSWVYDNTLEGYKSLCVAPISGTPVGPRPGDLPFQIRVPERFPRGIRNTDFRQSLINSVLDIEHNDRNNWFNNDFTHEEIDKGVILIFTNSPYGGGRAYTRIIGEYEDDTPYLFEVEIDSNLAQRSSEAVWRREFGRVLSLKANVPQNAHGYVMRIESVGWETFHPQEIEIINLHWDINRRFTTKADRPNMEWYLTD
ncbi:MAG: hypothetical protein P9X24_13205 [Candidatus Hatepunaea meridiana]|nr:hypothetical protein [Candidatus Hatepunaea meridiana]